jgi:hypothetical protein
VPDTGRNRSWIGKIRYRQGLAGYPVLRLMTLAETGTRALLGAAIGCKASRDEAGLARQLLPLLRPGMLVLLDRAFDASAFLAEVAATGAMLLARATSTRRPPVTGHLPDGSYRSDLDGLPVRIIEADLAVTGSDGSRVADTYRLITTLTDYRRYPAAALVRLYHERWEIESAYYALRHTQLDGHVLRSGDRSGVEQEVWALLTVYQLLRMAMVTAVETRPGTDPDRASFTTALEAARDQLTAAQGICPGGPADLAGAIGRAVLGTLLPARRPRYSARNVKCPTSRYHARDDGRPALPAVITAIDITICTPPLDHGERQRRSHRGRIPPLLGPHRPTRRDKITAIIASQPPRDWSGHELAVLLGVNRATCSPSSANGAGSGSSPAPASAPTGSTRRPLIHPRHQRPTLNFAALVATSPLPALTADGSSGNPSWAASSTNMRAPPDIRRSAGHDASSIFERHTISSRSRASR